MNLNETLMMDFYVIPTKAPGFSNIHNHQFPHPILAAAHTSYLCHTIGMFAAFDVFHWTIEVPFCKVC